MIPQTARASSGYGVAGVERPTKSDCLAVAAEMSSLRGTLTTTSPASNPATAAAPRRLPANVAGRTRLQQPLPAAHLLAAHHCWLQEPAGADLQTQPIAAAGRAARHGYCRQPFG